MRSINGGYNVFHAALPTPNFRRLPLALDIIRVNPTWVLNLNDCLPPIFVFHQEVGQIPPLVFLVVDPRDCDPVPLHPLNNMRIALEPHDHPPF
jgi:hypothetical protein